MTITYHMRDGGSPTDGTARSGAWYIGGAEEQWKVHQGESILTRADANLYRDLVRSGEWGSLHAGHARDGAVRVVPVGTSTGAGRVINGGVTLNVHPAPGMDERALADAVVERIRDLSDHGVTVINEKGIGKSPR